MNKELQLKEPVISTGENIKDIDIYNKRMAGSLLDKMFFVDKVNAYLFVDFGCADGTLLNTIHQMFPNEHKYVGYDINSKMIEIARQKCDPDIVFYSKKCDLLKEIKDARKDGAYTCLILSSVIHEVYAYSGYDEVNEFYKFIFGGIFDYIVIRDMMPNNAINRPSYITDVARVRALSDPKQLSSFEDIFGSIDNNRNLIHYLLKYKYVENWEREVRENYFPITTQKFLSKIPKEYDVDYYEEFILPYTKHQIENDYDITVKDTTHVKIILKKIE
jgi:SAM-dependent methyltransferase